MEIANNCLTVKQYFFLEIARLSCAYPQISGFTAAHPWHSFQAAYGMQMVASWMSVLSVVLLSTSFCLFWLQFISKTKFKLCETHASMMFIGLPAGVPVRSQILF